MILTQILFMKSYPLRKDEYMFKRLCYQIKLYQLAYPKSKAVVVVGFGNGYGYELLELPSLTPRDRLQLLKEIVEATKSIEIQEEEVAVVLNKGETVFYSYRLNT